MKLLKMLLCCASASMISIAHAQSIQELDVCQNLVLESETEYDATTYDDCGFDDVQTAFVHWVPLAEKNKWKNALYEIYKRHPNYPGVKSILYKAAEFGHPQALVFVGDELFEQNKIAQAMRYYNAAIRGDLSEEDQGKITARLGMLYANPDSPYYDIQKAVPLLRKAAMQRQAIANNVMGVYTLTGQNGVQQNPQEAFKYFWRAQLLGCKAAEENLGFFMMGHQRKIDNQMVVQEISDRIYSCDGVETTKNNLPIYHLSFTPKECANINYYAERLVDTELPFVGKEECAFSADMTDMAEFLSK